LAAAQGFPFWQLSAEVLGGWACPDEAGVEQVRSAVAAWRAGGTAVFLPYWLALLAEAEHEQGDAASAQAHLAQAVEQAERTGETCWSVELTRVAARLEEGVSPQAREESL
jgi:predicted ATPase